MSARARRVLALVALLVVIGVAFALVSGPVSPRAPAPSTTPQPSASAVGSQPTSTGGATTAPSTEPTVSAEPTGSLVAWTQLSSARVGPVARQGATWTVDPSTGIAYLYGGTTSPAVGPRQEGGATLGDLWAYDLAADSWEPVVGTSDEPPPRSGHVAAWVEDVGLVVLGGRGDDGRALDDVWRFDPGAGVWSQLPVSGVRPPARSDACGAAPGDGSIWLSHGTNGRSLFGSTWKLDLRTRRWTEVVRIDRPITRSGAACWVDAGGRFVVSSGDRGGTLLGDLWAISVGDADAAWSRLDGGGFAARRGAAVAIHLDQAVLVGGAGADGPLADLGTMAASDTSITPLPAAGVTPPARAGAVLVDDPAGERMLLFGGVSASGVLGDLWSLDLP